MERYTGRPVVGEKIGIVRSFGGSGKEMGDLPGDWICRTLGMNGVGEDDGRRDAVVDATAVYSEGVYFEESIWRGIGSVKNAVELIILKVGLGAYCTIPCALYSVKQCNKNTS
jgi:hypothetical protein